MATNATPSLLTDIPTEPLALLVLVRLGHGHGRARDIARTAFLALPDNQHALAGCDYPDYDHPAAQPTVKLFDVSDGTVLRTFTHHTDTVWCLALLPDGIRFISGSRDGTARIVALI